MSENTITRKKRIEKIRKPAAGDQSAVSSSPVIEGKWDKEKERPSFLGFDWILVAAVILILIFGMIMLYSASSYTAQISMDNPMFYVKRQAFATGVGLVAMLVVAFIPMKFWKILSVPAFIVGVVMIFLVRTSLGVENNGATRWIEIAGQSIQPSEVLKFGLILMLAFLITKLADKIDHLKGYVPVFLTGLFAAGLVASVTDDLGTAIIYFGMLMVVLILCCRNGKLIMGSVGILAAAAVAFVFSDSYRLERIQTWLNLESNADDKGYQIMQALYAIGSGGIFGKGLGKSTQKLSFVPEAENDMIFSIICEELGLMGVIMLIALYVVIIWRMKRIFDNATDIYSRLVVAGVAGHIAIQSIVNMCVVSNMLPNTGVPLPFISYGGTSTVILLAEIGLILSACRKRT